MDTLDDTANTLLKGGTINNFTIFDMMKGGGWANSKRLTPIKNAERQMKIEVMSRGINLLWNTSHSNKRWVLFTDLGDRDPQGRQIHDACLKDESGPPSTKYCADGGVYYTYNFDEGGGGKIAAPWGADKFIKIDKDFNISVSLLQPSAYDTHLTFVVCDRRFGQTLSACKTIVRQNRSVRSKCN